MLQERAGETRRMKRKSLPKRRMKDVVGRIKAAVIDERESEDEEPNEHLKPLTALPKEGMTEAVVEAAIKVTIVTRTGVEVAKTGVKVATVAKTGVKVTIVKTAVTEEEMNVMDEVAADKEEDETWLLVEDHVIWVLLVDHVT